MIIALFLLYAFSAHAAEVKNLKTGRSPLRDSTTGMEFVSVQWGCFQMGDIFGDGDRDEIPLHEVCVSNYAIGKFEVTRGQFRTFADASGYLTDAEKGDGCSAWTGSGYKKDRSYSWKNPGYPQGDSHPVVCVSWNDAVAFARWLSGKSGVHYRLPTEAEWEYAARSGGKREKFSGGNNPDNVGWHSGNSGGKTQSAGQKQPNGLGIYDMTGNVWEWCSDWYEENYYKGSPRVNPQGVPSGEYRVLRGGSWDDISGNARSSLRFAGRPDNWNHSVGFRLITPLND